MSIDRERRLCGWVLAKSGRVVKWKPDIFTWILDGEWAWMTFTSALGEDGEYVDYSGDEKIVSVEVIDHINENPELLHD